MGAFGLSVVIIGILVYQLAHTLLLVVSLRKRIARLEGLRDEDLGRFHARYESLVSLWNAERGKADASAIAERRELYSRLQAWEPEPGEKPAVVAPPKSQPAEHTEERWTSDELQRLGLAENTDGGYFDVKTGALYETVEDLQEWRAELRKRGLPENIHPATLYEQGAEVALEAAQSGEKGA